MSELGLLVWVTILADLVTVGLPAVGLLGWLLRQSPRFRRRVLSRPFRKAARTLAKSGRDNDVDNRLRSAAQDSILRASQRMEELLPADVIAEVQLATGGLAWFRTAPQLAEMFELAADAYAELRLARIFYAEEARRASAMSVAVSAVLRRFASCSLLVPSRQGASVGAASFGAFVTALTGAPVLVDASRARARFADEVLVWHSFAYHRSGSAVVSGERYEALHRGPDGCEVWRSAARPPGDYDTRVLHVRSAGMVEAANGGFVSVLLETAETCYAVTELGREAVGCKNIRPAWAAAEPRPLFAAVTDEGEFRYEHAAGERVTMLTAYATIMTADGWLALSRRSHRVRHGAGVISASAGGFVEPNGPGPGGDVNEEGLPDLFRTVAREAGEEIGVELSRSRCRPVCVFLANIRGRDTRPEQDGQDGQLVCVVLFLARIEASLHEVSERAASGSDPARGAYEQEGIVGCPMGSPWEMGKWAFKHATELDQHGIMSCVYGAVSRFGVDETRNAFATAFADSPWWALSPHRDGSPRLVRDPGTLVPSIPFPSEHAPPAWSAAFGQWRAPTNT